MALQDAQENTTCLTFDQFGEDSPMVIGLDEMRYDSFNFLSDPPMLTLNRPSDSEPRLIRLYIIKSSRASSRPYEQIVPPSSSVMLANVRILERSLSLLK